MCDFGVWADLSADLVTLKPKALLEIARQTMLLLLLWLPERCSSAPKGHESTLNPPNLGHIV